MDYHSNSSLGQVGPETAGPNGHLGQDDLKTQDIKKSGDQTGETAM